MSTPALWLNPFGEGQEPWIGAGDRIALSVLATAKPGTATSTAVAISASGSASARDSEAGEMDPPRLGPKKVIEKGHV